MTIWTVIRDVGATRGVGNSFLSFDLATKDIKRLVELDRDYYTGQGATYVLTASSSVRWVGEVTYPSRGPALTIEYLIFQRRLVGSALDALADCAE